MYDFINTVWGKGDQLNALQMSARAFIMFMIALTLIRLGGLRLFSKKSAFDNVIVIMLGAVLARGIVGASPFFSTVAASCIMIVIHRTLAWMSVKSDPLCKVLQGEHIVLFQSGNILWENMKKVTISEPELMASLRLETKKDTFDDIDVAYLETNGRISFILKKEKK
jgi:uncharacterized membrane protein YcaP (DUF421 family)